MLVHFTKDLVVVLRRGKNHQQFVSGEAIYVQLSFLHFPPI